jgi:hypothetical protein
VGAALVALIFALFDFSNGGAAGAARAAIWLAAGLRASSPGDLESQAPALRRLWLPKRWPSRKPVQQVPVCHGSMV